MIKTEIDDSVFQICKICGTKSWMVR